MPIYEYKCRKCGHGFEMMQRFSDQPVKKCPECSGTVDKLISQSTFHLKGSGWYATDYGKKSHGGKPGKKKSEDNGSTESEDKGSAEKETKTKTADK